MTENRSKTFWIIYGYLFLIVLLRLIPLANPLSRTWGFDHQTYLSPPHQIVFFALCAVALIFPFVKIRLRIGEKLTGLFNDYFYEHRYSFHFRLIVIIPAFILFYSIPQPTHFLGDGYEAIDILFRPDPFFLKFSQTGALWFYEMARALIGPETEKTAELTFRIVSALCGALYIFLVFKIAGIAFESGFKRLLVWIFSVFSGILLMFFGYAEFYAPVVVLSLLYLYFGLSWLKNEKGPVWPVLIFLVGLYFHLIFMFYIPSLLVLIFNGNRGREIYRKYRKSIYTALSLIVVAALAGFVYYYKSNLVFENMFLSLFSGKDVAPDYAVFTPPHLLDIFNEFMLVAPVSLIFLIIGIGGYGSAKKGGALSFVLIASAGFLPFIFGVDPQLSMARDWDLFSMTVIPFVFLSVLVVPKYKTRSIGGLILSILLLCIIFSTSFLTVQLERKKSVTYFENLIDMNRLKSISSLTVLTDYYKSHGLNSKADSLRGVFQRRFTNYALITGALSRISAGDLRTAIQLSRRIKPDRFNADYHRLMADIYSLTGRQAEAAKEMAMALQLRPRAPVYYYDMARISFLLHEYEKAGEYLYTGYGLAPEDKIFFEGLSYYYLMATSHYDSSAKYAHLWRNADTSQPSPLYYLAKAYALDGNRKMAELYYDSLMMLPQNDSSIVRKQIEVGKLLGKDD